MVLVMMMMMVIMMVMMPCDETGMDGRNTPAKHDSQTNKYM